MLGIISALGAACSWTYACFLWRQQTQFFSALQLNSIKNIIAFIIFFPVVFTFDFLANYKEIFILFLSGVIGISIGDSLYISSLKILGTRRTLTVEAFSPIIATISGAIFLNEMLSLKVYFGVALVSISLIGVAFQTQIGKKHIISHSSIRKGFGCAFLSVLCAVIAATLSRLVLTSSDLNTFQTSEIRLIGSIITLVPFLGNNLNEVLLELPLKNKIILVYSTFLGTNIGILLQQNVFKMLPIGLGWTLLSTSPAIALFFSRAEGEQINWKTIALTSMTILGVSMVLI